MIQFFKSKKKKKILLFKSHPKFLQFYFSSPVHTHARYLVQQYAGNKDKSVNDKNHEFFFFFSPH